MKYLAIWFLVGLLCLGGLAVSPYPVKAGEAALFAYVMWVLLSAWLCAMLGVQQDKKGGGS